MQFAQNDQLTILKCERCNGSGIGTAGKCSQCQGKGRAAWWNNELLYWNWPVSRYHISLRRGRNILNTLRVMGGLVFAFSFIGLFIWNTYRLNLFTEIFQIVTGRIKFVDDILLSDKDINKAVDLVAGIDADDAMFVALTNRMLATLWTGDKQLIKGLKRKGYSRIISTDELYAVFINKKHKSSRKIK